MNTAKSSVGVSLNLGDAIPVIVGVSGHKNATVSGSRSLQDLVQEQWLTLQKQVGQKDGPGLLLLTGLAEGADQIVAKAAQALGIPYVAVLPMPLEAYLDEFTTDAAKQELKDHIANAAWTVELPPPPGVTLENLRLVGSTEPAAREDQYVALGALLASTCDVLIALWDGQPFQAGTVGGTAHVVHLMRDRSASLQQAGLIARPVPVSDTRAVLHLKVSRQGRAPVADEGQWSLLLDYATPAGTTLTELVQMKMAWLRTHRERTDMLSD